MSGKKKSRGKDDTLSDNSDKENSEKKDRILAKNSNLGGQPNGSQAPEEGEIVDPVGNQAQEEDQS